MVTALREAFPEDLQGMYDASEMQNVPDNLPEKEIKVYCWTKTSNYETSIYEGVI